MSLHCCVLIKQCTGYNDVEAWWQSAPCFSRAQSHPDQRIFHLLYTRFRALQSGSGEDDNDKTEPQRQSLKAWAQPLGRGGFIVVVFTLWFNFLILNYCLKISLLWRRFYWTFLCAISAKVIQAAYVSYTLSGSRSVLIYNILMLEELCMRHHNCSRHTSVQLNRISTMRFKVYKKQIIMWHLVRWCLQNCHFIQFNLHLKTMNGDCIQIIACMSILTVLLHTPARIIFH